MMLYFILNEFVTCDEKKESGGQYQYYLPPNSTSPRAVGPKYQAGF
jgi:hypothetical protein